VLGHVLGPFVNLAHCCVTAFDAPLRDDSSFHVFGCLDVIALINVASNVALQGSCLAAKYVLPSLGLTEVTTSCADTNVLSETWKTEKKKCAMITQPALTDLRKASFILDSRRFIVFSQF